MNSTGPMHWTTRIGVAGVVLCVAVVVTLNVVGWLNTLPGVTGIAAACIAVGLELVAFVSWEHITKYAKGRDFGRLLLALIGLTVAAAVNIEGGHRGVVHLAAPLYEQADRERRESQAALDAERAVVQAEISTAQARIDAVPLIMEGGPQSRGQNRLIWESQTALDRQAVEAAQARLAAMPIMVAGREPFPQWAPYALTAAFAFFSLFGLTMFGVKVADVRPRAKPRAAPSAPRQTASASIPMAANANDVAYLNEDAKRADGFRRIQAGERPHDVARALGISPATCRRWAIQVRRGKEQWTPPLNRKRA